MECGAAPAAACRSAALRFWACAVAEAAAASKAVSKVPSVVFLVSRPSRMADKYRPFAVLVTPLKLVRP